VPALNLAVSLVVAVIVSVLVTPVVAIAAVRLGVVDQPNQRKVNRRRDMPLLGGLAVAAGATAGLAALTLRSPDIVAGLDGVWGILVGGSIMLVIGVVDDRFGLGALQKLSAQILAAGVAYAAGFAILAFREPVSGTEFELPIWLSVAVTTVWIVGVTNAINLIDGLDGLAAGLSAIVAATLSFVCFQAGQFTGLVFGLCLVGGLIGFLPYNFPPAKIFLGDTGALFIGYLLSLIAIEGYEGGYRKASVLAFVVPLLALAVPLLDTALSIFRRMRSGRRIFDADRMHMHHRLLHLNEGSQPRAVLFLYLLTACFCIIAVSFTRLKDLAASALLLAAVVVLTVRLLHNVGILSTDDDEQDDDVQDGVVRDGVVRDGVVQNEEAADEGSEASQPEPAGNSTFDSVTSRES
jgi:UDP-GlcNAc:undecaprenyl-phosphate GlcNAc-1-phosphate transferase